MKDEYKVTELHPVYRKNLLIIKDEDGDFALLADGANPNIHWESIEIRDIKRALRNGWIEEIQKPEFTEDDMKKAYHAGIDCFDRSKRGLNNVPFFNVLLTSYSTCYLTMYKVFPCCTVLYLRLLYCTI